MFELSQVRCFVAVAEELHFGRAAARLNMTQPPLSRQIQILERILGVKLLQRGNRLVRLTPAGQSFLTEARLILKLTESAALLARRVAEGKAGSVNIGFTAASSYSYVPELVAACRQQLPDVELILKEMVSGDQLKRLGAGEIDIGLLRQITDLLSVVDAERNPSVIRPQHPDDGFEECALPRSVRSDDCGQAARLESEDRYRDLVDHSRELILVHELSGEIVFANPATCGLLGRPADELIGDNLRSCRRPTVLGRF